MKAFYPVYYKLTILVHNYIAKYFTCNTTYSQHAHIKQAVPAYLCLFHLLSKLVSFLQRLKVSVVNEFLDILDGQVNTVVEVSTPEDIVM